MSAMKNAKWYEKILQSNFRNILISGGAILLLLFIMSVMQITRGYVFVWKNITPIEQPSFFERTFYSALTFITLGAFLYYIRFYQLLSWIFGSDRSGYRDVKAIVWLGLLLVMYTIIVPVVINILNCSISFVYNISLLLLFISPVAFLLLTLISVIVIYKLLKDRQNLG